MVTGDIGLYGERLAVALGFGLLAAFIGMGLTCRTFMSFATRIGLGNLIRSRPYQAMYKRHSIFWYGVEGFLVLHVLTGIMHTTLPRAGDADAGFHAIILIFAGCTVVSLGLTFTNCRAFASILRIFKGDRTFSGSYKPYYGFHAYFWILLLAALAGHLVASYLHIGLWPSALAR